MSDDRDNQDALSGDDKDLIILNYQTLVETILVANNELGQDLVRAKLTPELAEIVLGWQASCRDAVDAAGDAIGRILMKRRGTH